MDFIMNGRQYQVAREQVELRMRDVQPLPGLRHFVEVNGQEYPVKQVLLEALRQQNPDVSTLDFTTQRARNILARLGFRVLER